MALEIVLGDRTANVELLSKTENMAKIRVDEKVYDIDIEKIANGVYSILLDGVSFNVELIEGDQSKKYIANTLYNSFDVEIIDAESKYLKNRNKSAFGGGDNEISSPMPGKVVKIPVEPQEEVKEGQTLIIVSAMKMESEYKAPKDGVVKEIYVGEGDTVEANQTLVLID
jgi:biotin carboxyl carrier protein